MTELKWRILEALSEAKDEMMTLSEIIAAVAPGVDRHEQTIRQAVYSLRDSGLIRRIERSRYELWSLGRRLLGEVEEDRNQAEEGV